MPLLEDIVTFFVSEGLIEGDGIDTFRDFQPAAPDNLVSFHEYSGDKVSPYTEVVHRSVQVVVRNKSAEEARRKAQALFNALRNAMSPAGRVDFTPTRWGQVHLRQAPFRFSQDESDRVSYGFNLGITTDIE